MKFRMLFVVSFVICLLLSACGGGSSSPKALYNVINSGNWSIVAKSAASGAKLDIGGSLVQSGTTISGVMHVANSSCFDLVNDDVPLTGSFLDNTLTLTSPLVHNQILTITVSGAGNTLTGTYLVTGGCADGDHGTVAGAYQDPVTGTWTSTFTDGGATVTASAAFTQAAAADAHGRFPLTGTFTFTGSPCFTGATITGSTTSASSAVWGDITSAVASTSDVGGGQGTIVYLGTASNATTMAGTYQVTSGICKGNSSFLQFSKQ